MKGIAGEWQGTFGTLTITTNRGVIDAALLTHGWVESFKATLLDGNILELKGRSADYLSSPDHPVGNYSLDTIRLELSSAGDSLTGQNRDKAGRSGPVALQKDPH